MKLSCWLNLIIPLEWKHANMLCVFMWFQHVAVDVLYEYRERCVCVCCLSIWNNHFSLAGSAEFMLWLRSQLMTSAFLCEALKLRGMDGLGGTPLDRVQHISCQFFSLHISQDKVLPDREVRLRTLTGPRSSYFIFFNVFFNKEDRGRQVKEV